MFLLIIILLLIAWILSFPLRLPFDLLKKKKKTSNAFENLSVLVFICITAWNFTQLNYIIHSEFLRYPSVFGEYKYKTTGKDY